MIYKIVNYITASIVALITLLLFITGVWNTIQNSFSADDYLYLTFFLILCFIIVSKQMIFGLKIAGNLRNNKPINISIIIAWILWFSFLAFTIFCAFGVYQMFKSYINVKQLSSGDLRYYATFYLVFMILLLFVLVLNTIILVFDVMYLITIKHHNKMIHSNHIDSIGL
jgi:hypothetical protein